MVIDDILCPTLELNTDPSNGHLHLHAGLVGVRLYHGQIFSDFEAVNGHVRQHVPVYWLLFGRRCVCDWNAAGNEGQEFRRDYGAVD